MDSLAEMLEEMPDSIDCDEAAGMLRMLLKGSNAKQILATYDLDYSGV
jgi:hypothetical protein